MKNFLPLNTSEFIYKSSLKTLENITINWQTPSNIALVKYWGKTDCQIPKNSSISFTLKECYTKTSIEFIKTSKKNYVDFEFIFEGKKNDKFKPKITAFFQSIKEYCSFILEYRMIINSKNSFPHSSGIASSASGMSAIAMCLMSLEKELNPKMLRSFFYKKASFLARLGSGSASRSIQGPIMIWGKSKKNKNSSNLFAIKCPYTVHEIFKNYQDTILLVDKGEKQVSSTAGHNLMYNHPFSKTRFKQANKNLSKILKVIQNGNIKKFINIVESEALSLHAMMLTSKPYFILFKPNTIKIINEVWKYRNNNNSNICFTLDAGANVHLLYPENEKNKIKKFVDNILSKYCQNNQYICDTIGLGAEKYY